MMNRLLGAFGMAVRVEREKRKLSQERLAEILGMNKRTIMQAENAQSNLKFETIVLLAKELQVSVDAILFSEIASPNNVPKCVYDFFKDKSENEAQKFIEVCRATENLIVH